MGKPGRFAAGRALLGGWESAWCPGLGTLLVVGGAVLSVYAPSKRSAMVRCGRADVAGSPEPLIFRERDGQNPLVVCSFTVPNGPTVEEGSEEPGWIWPRGESSLPVS